MLKRKITQKLLEWKKEEKKPCLLIRRARQVGKTFIIDDFAKKHYKNYICTKLLVPRNGTNVK